VNRLKKNKEAVPKPIYISIEEDKLKKHEGYASKIHY
jgi:hypothetical protein